MIDPTFTAGRITNCYKEVPSNTLTGLFAQWATGTSTFREIVKTSDDGSFAELMKLDQDKTCMLGQAIGVAQMLSDGLGRRDGVDFIKSSARHLVRSEDESVWSLPEHGISANKVVLAQGSHPRRFGLVDEYPHLKELDLELTLTPSELSEKLPAGAVVGVVGASHSAVLAMKNIYEARHDVRIVNFSRGELLYAEYMDGWILYDNTGLKGLAAEWAREVLESDDPRIRRVSLRQEGKTEAQIYEEELGRCTHLAAAVGFDRNPMPVIEVGGERVDKGMVFDGLTDASLIAMTDSDWASDPTNCRSQSGYFLKLAGSAFTWTSHQQKTVTLSSTEAEYMVLASELCASPLRPPETH